MKNFFRILQGKNKRTIKAFKKSKGQSFVEFILLSVPLIMLFTGMVEFGFMLNTYLNLLDATRQAARYYSNVNPYKICEDDPDAICDDEDFYPAVSDMVEDYLAPDADTNKIILDPAEDDIIVTVAVVSVSESTGDIVSVVQHPYDDTYWSWSKYNTGAENQTSGFTDEVIDGVLVTGDEKIEKLMTNDGTITPIRTGLLIVELYYGYDGVLKLPWLQMFFSQPVVLHSYTFMPLVAARPDKIE